MNPNLSSYSSDIVIRIRPGRSERSRPQSGGRYQAFFYGALPVNGPFEVSDTPEPWGDLPLRASALIEIDWHGYEKMLAEFLEGSKGVEKLSLRLRAAFSSQMRSLLDPIAYSSARRVWWASDAPELDDMPWELLFHSPYGMPTRVNCVRGVPPSSPPPILPLDGPLRLLWMASQYTPPWASDLLNALSNAPRLQPIPSHEGVRATLKRAAKEGIELIHCFSDGVVSLAYEGALYDHQTHETVSPSEISDLLSGTRASILGLTPQDTSSSDEMPLAGRKVVSAFRAFSCLGSARFPLPSIVATLGPYPDDPQRFWKAFYEQLGDGPHLDKAMSAARAAAPGAPYAFFIRHAGATLFRSPTVRAFGIAPQKVALEFGNATSAVDKIARLEDKFGQLPDYLTKFANAEKQRHQELGAELQSWAIPAQGEE